MKTPEEIINEIWMLLHKSERERLGPKEELQQIIKLLKDEGVISQSPSMFDAQ